MKMEHKVTLMVSVRHVGCGEPCVVMEKAYWTGEASAENARKAILRLKDMGLCEGVLYKVIKSANDNFFVGVF